MDENKQEDIEEKAGKGFPFTVVRHVVQVVMLLIFLVPLFVRDDGGNGFRRCQLHGFGYHISG